MEEVDQFFWKFYAMKTPSGFMCKFCSKVYDNESFLSLISHLADKDVADHSCLLVPKYARERLRLVHSRKRNYSTSSTDQCPPSGGKRTLLSTIGVQLPTTEIVGKQFDEYIKNIWSCLMDDGDNHVFTIGIHGMGGVGKTQVAKYINNKLLQCPGNKFRHVFWVNMSSIWSLLETQLPSRRVRVRDVQSCISKAVGVDVSDGDDESKRASQLLKGLAEKKKSVLILDDVWDCFSLEEVGIPIGVDQCTLVITTRSLQVCRQFGCQRKIKIRCLPPDESYQLFKKKLGNNETILSREAEEVSRLVADKCVGLPLAITIMARNMKGVTDIRQWRNALRGGGYTRKKAETEIFQNLKTSYDYLKDATLQHCFLYCSSLVPKARGTERFTKYWADQKRLAEYLVDEGIVKSTNRRREALDEAHTMLNFLSDAGLLEITSCYFIQINALIQSMALQIIEDDHENHPMMIKNDMFLKELLDDHDESWSGDLVRVSLQGNEFENIRSNYSPRCSKISTLLLGQNWQLGYIGDSFFEGMPGLKVLDLSLTGIESLPRSVCDLVNLTTLLLSRCFKLRSIPSVAKLRALKKLDLNATPVLEQVPEGIEMLSKLTYLNLGCIRVEELKLAAILTKLSQLQFLTLPEKLAVKGEEIACLRKLETLNCTFCDVAELNKYLIHLKGKEEPIQLDVKVGPGTTYGTEFEDPLFYEEGDFEVNADHFNDKDLSVLALNNCDVNEADMLMMIYFQQIAIVKCNDARSLCNFSPIKGATELKYLSIRDCDELLFLCSSSSLTGDQGALENVEYLELFNLKNLNELFNCIQAGNDVCKFSNLTRFCIQDCPSIKRLFSIHLLLNMKNLQRFRVFACLSMEEIFADDEESKMDGKKEICYLPHLRIFSLQDLPELTRVCGGRTKTCAIPRSCTIQVLNCPKLKYDGISLY